MSDDFASTIENIRQQTAAIRSERDALRKEIEAEREANAELKEKLVAARRSGELGSEWRVLQQRIDIFQTTEDDIYNGIDLSPEARSVRKTMGEYYGRAQQEMQEGDGSEELLASNARLDREREKLVETLRDLLS
ncbi:hypothetical protein [Mycetocola saprophilus]|uniref:hypothetical protein n=1 Tax=Mycetocola saprophilus TaxID=76636 RepID=UPI003BF1122A